ncbi:MAG TPA: hypothetical protein VME46_19455 [Acidimicrobiales bacterium]|nr:hypothetical protein [Acidimicrobiales bacterium]
MEGPNTSRHDAWQRFSAGAAELATEVREREAQLQARMARPVTDLLRPA